ncbi:DUF3325 family protein [Diaphorobacter sp. HDW4A]|uniref:DUF3325 family protein n=1 Tax=Diaphorobacter sp. HDW4A TaxID=2714924 RepID=UPI00140E0AED|nr:DUF3325 family protein [Diaphorobacter sp. HDW4A]QIL80541.1 DUF3325 family protein [Diaphorobacter sp. HDW4A]
MTPDALTGAHLLVLALGLLAFLSLAFATERHGEHLLGRMPARRWRRFARMAGWLVLGLSLAFAIGALDVGVGIALWLGWLSIAALAWVFTFPRWPWQPPARDKPQRNVKSNSGAGEVPSSSPMRRRARAISALLLLATIIVFAAGISRVQIPALERSYALKGQAGPWPFTLVESDRNPPELVDMDIPMKEFRLRFCDECDQHIRLATLKVNKPRSPRATGMGFMGQRWERRAEIPLPSTLRADSELWLTVTGKDGSVHQTFWRMDQVSPAAVAWFEQQRTTSNAQP